MGCVVVVDAEQVAAVAARMAPLPEDLERAGAALAQALRAVSAAVGGGTLAAAAEVAAAQWQGGMAQVAEQGRQLARATLEAAELYRSVETRVARAWGPADPRDTP